MADSLDEEASACFIVGRHYWLIPRGSSEGGPIALIRDGDVITINDDSTHEMIILSRSTVTKWTPARRSNLAVTTLTRTNE